MNNLPFCKVREEAKEPRRGHETDAGADLFYCYDPKFDYDKSLIKADSEKIDRIIEVLKKHNFMAEHEFEEDEIFLNKRMHGGTTDEKTIAGDRKIRIPPGASVAIPTGLKFIVPEGYELHIDNKSGVAYKKQLLVGACVVDPDYRGEVFVNLHNLSGEERVFEPGQKLAQMIPRKVEHPELVELSAEDYDKNKTERGDGCLGSTGDK